MGIISNMNSYYLKRGFFKTSLFIATTAILMLEHRSSEIERPSQSKNDVSYYERFTIGHDPFNIQPFYLDDVHYGLPNYRSDLHYHGLPDYRNLPGYQHGPRPESSK